MINWYFFGFSTMLCPFVFFCFRFFKLYSENRLSEAFTTVWLVVVMLGWMTQLLAEGCSK